MKKKDIISALESADENYILEAGIAGGHFRDSAPERTDCQAGAAPEGSADPILLSGQRRRRPWTAAAAVLLLALACGAAWALLLHYPGGKTGPTPGRNEQLSATLHGPETTATASDVTPTEFVWPTDFPYPSASEMQWLLEHGLSLEDWYRLQQEPNDSIDNRPTSDITPDPELEEALLGLKVGGLYLGQPQAEVLSLYGEPNTRGISDVVQTDGTRRDCWGYRFGEQQGLWIDFVDAGGGFVVNRISSSAELQGEMPLGIRIGMPFDEAEAAFAQSPVIDAVKHREDYNQMNVGTGSMQGSLFAVVTDVNTGRPGLLRLDVSYRDQNENGPHYVNYISLGQLYDDPPEEEIDPETEARQRRFESGEISVWLPTAGIWQGETFRKEEAKTLEMTFAISLPEPWDYDGSDPIAVLDFHTDAVVHLYDEAGHAGIYHLTDRAAFEQGLAAGDPGRGLELWEYGCLGPDVLPAATNPYALAADWNFNYSAGALMEKLIEAVRAKDAEIFTSSDGTVTMFREKGHYVIAGVFAGEEKITSYGRFFEDHTLYDSTVGFPLIDPTPEKLMKMDLNEIRAAYGAPAFETDVNGVSCPCYIASGGYIAVLQTEGGVVTSILLYDGSSETARVIQQEGPGRNTP